MIDAKFMVLKVLTALLLTVCLNACIAGQRASKAEPEYDGYNEEIHEVYVYSIA